MKIEITIDGKKYPCRGTMGALIRYKKETGEEVSDIVMTDLAKMCTYLWACVSSASAADGIEFNMTPMEFADSIEPQQLDEWAAAMSEGVTKDEDKETEKKR